MTPHTNLGLKIGGDQAINKPPLVELVKRSDDIDQPLSYGHTLVLLSHNIESFGVCG